MQVLGRADRLVGLVILGESDLDLLDELGLGHAGIGLGSCDFGTGLRTFEIAFAP